MLVDGVIQQALIATVQLDGKQGVRHRVHDTRRSLLGSTHSTADANRCTVLPAKVGQLPHDDHDALDSVFVLQTLRSKVGGGVAWALVGDRSRSFSPYTVGFSDTEAPLPRTGLRRDANRRSLFFEFAFASPFFIEHQLRFAQGSQTVVSDLCSVLLAQGRRTLAGVAEGFEEGFPSC